MFFFLRLIRVDQGNGTFANSRTSIELGEGEVRLETHFEFEMGYFVKLIWWAIKRLSNFVFVYEGKDRKLQIGLNSYVFHAILLLDLYLV